MLRSRNLSVEIQPFLHHVADRLEETTYLGMLVDGGLLNMEQVCGPHLIQHVGWQGRRTPFYCTSAGKVLAASLSSEELDYLFRTQDLTAFTQQTITQREKLLEELALVREQGYALNIGELDNHHHAVAVPIHWRGGDLVVAALGVVGPAFRFTEALCLEAVPFLTSVAQEISSRLSSTIFAPQVIQKMTPPDKLKMP
jgi:DNA-binding IclR family transcriptional regulator